MISIENRPLQSFLVFFAIIKICNNTQLLWSNINVLIQFKWTETISFFNAGNYVLLKVFKYKKKAKYAEGIEDKGKEYNWNNLTNFYSMLTGKMHFIIYKNGVCIFVFKSWSLCEQINKDFFMVSINFLLDF